jgi:hypothetical protein
MIAPARHVVTPSSLFDAVVASGAGLEAGLVLQELQ